MKTLKPIWDKTVSNLRSRFNRESLDSGLTKLRNHLTRHRYKYTVPLSIALITGSMFASFLKVPSITTHSIEDFMKHNNIPEALVKDMDVSDIRVYKRGGPLNIHTTLSSYHAALNIWDGNIGNNKEFNETFHEFKDGKACIIRTDAKYDIINIFEKERAQEKFSDFVNIPLKDLNINEEQALEFFYMVFAHEVGHAQNETYKGFENLKLEDTILATLSGEIMADARAAQAAINIGKTPDLLMAWRSVSTFKSNITGTHSTARYLDFMINSRSKEDWPDLELRRYRQDTPMDTLVADYDSFVKPPRAPIEESYCTYMGALETQKQLQRYMSEKERFNQPIPKPFRQSLREIDMFICGFEYLVKPEKIEELRELKKEIDAKCAIEQAQNTPPPEALDSIPG